MAALMFAGAIGGFCGPYVVGALVNRGGYVTCMQVLGGLFLVEAAMMFGEPPAHPLCASVSICIPYCWSCSCACMICAFMRLLIGTPQSLPLQRLAQQC